MGYREQSLRLWIRCKTFSKWYYSPFARVNQTHLVGRYLWNRAGILPPGMGLVQAPFAAHPCFSPLPGRWRLPHHKSKMRKSQGFSNALTKQQTSIHENAKQTI